MQTGTVSRLWLRGRSWRFEIHFWWNIVRFWKSYICSNKLDVQETNFSFAQLNRIRNHFLGCRLTHGRHSRAWLTCGIWSLLFFTEIRIRVNKYRETRAPHKLSTRKKSHGMIVDLNNVDLVSSNANSSRKEAMLYIFEDNEAVIKMIIKGRNEATWTLKSKSSILTPKTNSQTYWPRETSHVMSGIICWICLTLAISVLQFVLKWWRNDLNKIQVKKVTAKSKPMMNLVSRYSVKDPNVLASTASESPGQTKSECLNVPLSSLNGQQTRTGR